MSSRASGCCGACTPEAARASEHDNEPDRLRLSSAESRTLASIQTVDAGGRVHSIGIDVSPAVALTPFVPCASDARSLASNASLARPAPIHSYFSTLLLQHSFRVADS
jgi:hypothetical protein